jgi:hypothetical protein
LEVDISNDSELPPLIMYQCDCVTFINYDRDGVHHISSDELLREVMPSFSSAFLYPKKWTANDPALYPSEYKVKVMLIFALLRFFLSFFLSSCK